MDVNELPYFLAHNTHRHFLVRKFRKKNDECILSLVIYWEKKQDCYIPKLATII